MAAIEHRQKETLLQAFDHFDKPNWAIFYGTDPRDHYIDGDKSDGRNRLDNYLDIIAGNGTNATYTLRVYNDLSVEPTSKTPFSQSTTFNLSGAGMVSKTGENTFVIGGTGGNNNPANTNALVMLQNEVKDLKGQLTDVTNKWIEERLKNIEAGFESRISGIQNQQPEKNGWDKFIDIFERVQQNPDLVEKTLSGIGNIFRGAKDYIVNNPQPQNVAGTNENEMAGTKFVNHLLTDDERKLSGEKQAAIMVERLTPLTEDQHQDIQNDCMESLESRIGNVTLTRMLIAVAGMDDKNLNKLLTHLD